MAGSLLGVAVNRARFSFPVGKVDMKTLYPMDMEEFMLAMGEEALAEQIKKCRRMALPVRHRLSGLQGGAGQKAPGKLSRY